MATPSDLTLFEPFILVENAVAETDTNITPGRFTKCGLGYIRQVPSGYTDFDVDDVILYRLYPETSFEQASTPFIVIEATDIIAISTYTPPPPEEDV